MGLFRSTISKIKGALSRTREGFVGGLRSLLAGRVLNDQLLGEIEARFRANA